MLWGGTPLWLLQAAREQRVSLFTSTALLADLTNIMIRTKFDKKIVASKLTIDQLVDRYADLSTLARPIPVSGIAPDPDDDVVIGTALAAQAQWIVTGEKPLLSVTEHRGVRIVPVSEAVQSLTTNR